jgi:sulfopyruvate decarboxylase subunit alpha
VASPKLSSPLPLGEGQGEGVPSSSPVDQFLAALDRAGFDFFAGVPCSLLTGVIRALDGDRRRGYLSAVREDVAIGAAAGAYFGGALPVVFMQNSGLGTSLNALTSMTLMYELPLLIVVSWRGEGGRNDAPEHILAGAVMHDLLDLIGIPHALLDPAQIDEQVVAAAEQTRASHRPYALVVRKGILD